MSVTSRGGGKNHSNRIVLALAIVEGNLAKVEEIVDAYIALYQGKDTGLEPKLYCTWTE